MEKKGQGEMFWVIVFAVLAIVVLVVLIAVFGSRISVFDKDVQSCTLRGGTCQALCGSNTQQIENVKCPTTEKPVCCLALPGA